jgi:hypothetical protein
LGEALKLSAAASIIWAAVPISPTPSRGDVEGSGMEAGPEAVETSSVAPSGILSPAAFTATVSVVNEISTGIPVLIGSTVTSVMAGALEKV